MSTKINQADAITTPILVTGAAGQVGSVAFKVEGDLTDLQDVGRCLKGCKRLYFGMSASSSDLKATVNTASVAKYYGVELFLNISQMTVSENHYDRWNENVKTLTGEKPLTIQEWVRAQAKKFEGGLSNRVSRVTSDPMGGRDAETLH